MEIRELNADELAALKDGFTLLSRVANEKHPVTFSGLQKVYDTIITDKTDFPELVISLGLGFGQQFVETGRYEWVRVSNEYGEETCVSPKKLKINVAPISMIQKRIEDNLKVDFRDLFEETDKLVREMIQSNDYDIR